MALTNQLRAELERFWPGPTGLFQKLGSPISLAFLERYPSPTDARTLSEQRLSAYLQRQRYSGHKKPGELLAKLRRAPEGRVGDAELAARGSLVLALVAAIAPLVDQIKQLDRQIATAPREHPDGEISCRCSAALAAWSPRPSCSRRSATAERATRPATRSPLTPAQAAVAIESGKRKTASFRWGCNKRLRSAFCTLADSTRPWHPLAQDRYAAARARGHDHDHPRAPRTVGRAWCRVVWGCWQDRIPDDPARHRALQEHCTVTQRAAHRAERAALDGKPTSAITLRG